MTIHAIVEQIYRDRRVKEFIRKQQPSDLQEDLLHHCISEIYRIAEKYPGKIEQLHADNQLWAYFHGMACQQMHSAKSTFWSKYRRPYMDLNESNCLSIKEEVPENDDKATFDALVARLGAESAKYVVLEIERQESLRIANFGKEKVVKFKQPELF